MLPEGSLDGPGARQGAKRQAPPANHLHSTEAVQLLSQLSVTVGAVMLYSSILLTFSIIKTFRTCYQKVGLTAVAIVGRVKQVREQVLGAWRLGGLGLLGRPARPTNTPPRQSIFRLVAIKRYSKMTSN